MSNIKFLIFSVVFCITFLSCKSDFEVIRSSGDPELMRQAAFKFFDEEKYVQSQSLLEAIIPAFRGKQESAEIFYKYAYTHFYLKEYILASHYFKNFADTYFNDPNREEALYMAAYSNFQLSPNARLDQSYSDLAIVGFQNYINTFPNSDRVEEANKLIDVMRKKQEDKAFQEGQLYFDLKQYQSSMVSFDNMLSEYPESSRAEEIKFKVIQSAYFLAENSVYSKKEERYKDALERINKFKLKYPKSKYRKNINKLIENCNHQLNLI